MDLNESSSKVEKTSSDYCDAEWDKHIQPHGPILELSEGKLWTVEGTLNNGKIKRNMIIYKMEDGNLWCHSVVALNKEGMDKLETFGKPTMIVVPNLQHTIDAGVYQKRYPEACLSCPKEFKNGLIKKGLRVDGIVQELFDSNLGIKSLTIEGFKPSGVGGIGGEMAFELSLNNDSVALIFTDVLMNQIWNTGIMKFLMGNSFECPRIIRWFGIQNKSLFKAWLQKFSDSSKIQVICVGHGPAITENCSGAFKKAILDI
jgi:hypothetical protein